MKVVKKRTCDHCNSEISLSNFEKHRVSASCKNGGKNRTKPEKYPWESWKIKDDLYQLECGYIGNKVACRNKLNSKNLVEAGKKCGNLTSFNEEKKRLGLPAHNKGKKATQESKEKLSKSLKLYFVKNGTNTLSEETKNLLSIKKKQLYKDHPEKHPNYKLAGNRNKMNYPETVAHDWFKKNGIKAEHNQKIDRFYPDFTVGSVIIEIDGARWHSSPEQVARDQKRDAILKAAGYTIYRVSTKENIEQRLQEIFK